MFDPLNSANSGFGDLEQPAWPSTPHPPGSPVPNLRRAISPALPVTPEKEPTPGLYGKEPKIYGQPESGLVSPREALSSNGTSFEKPDPYLKVRITGLDRNRRDILIKFDSQVRRSFVSIREASLIIVAVLIFADKSIQFHWSYLPQRVKVLPRVPAILRSHCTE